MKSTNHLYTTMEKPSLRLQEVEPQERIKETYKIKSKKLGTMYASFSFHAYSRMEERNISLIDVLSTLTIASDMLHSICDDGDILLTNKTSNCSIILSVSTFMESIVYFNLITVLAGTPNDEEGNPRFHDIKHFVSI